ncbi:MAG: Fe-S cluster assembly protein SufD [Flavobacteriales bacterium]|nr:Fe-S cluster assembly protein SufD [Flavobacteriales bacterium]MBP9078781.1 Fe-S cluster assembly protein SufD [Flavobacteriales bacterium]
MGTAVDPRAAVLSLLDANSWPGSADALARAAELPIPGRRTEQWKYTPVAKLFNTPYVKPDGQVRVELPARLPFAATRVVFVNGHFRPDLSDDLKADKGVVIDSIRHHLSHGPLKANYGRIAPIGDRLFTAMNTAAPTDGLIILATKGACASRPVHILRITAGMGSATSMLIQPRDLFMLHEGAKVEVVDEHIAVGNTAASLVNGVRESMVGEGAELTLHLLQNEAAGPADIGMDCVEVAASGRFSVDTTTLYGTLVRNDLQVQLRGPGAHAELHGAYLLDGDAHCDNHSYIGHNVPHCTSDELYKGIVAGNATGVFNGKVYVKQDAQRTLAYQRNANILQGDDARVYSKPELEIYADDVKCSHGCTIGRMDEQALFYLRSRGVSDAEARKLMAHAFVTEVVERIANVEWRTYLTELMDAKLAAV